MSMLDWAKREVELACKKENPNWDGESFDYGIGCYQSALKAFESLLEDEHSGMSIGFTKNILNRLIDCRPLTTITDEDFNNTDILESEEYLKERGLKSSKQCPRCSSLFREETLDGKISYHDIDRYYCFNINNPNITYTGGGAGDIIDELFPITMPYYPTSSRYKIACEDFLVDKAVGDYDTQAYFYIITPEGERIEINKFYKFIITGTKVCEGIKSLVENENGELVEITGEPFEYSETERVEISEEEYLERKAHRIINNYEEVENE